MMLQQVAKRFNRTKCTDAYTGEGEFLGQLDVYDDSKRDGLTAQRRILEVAPGTPLPTRGVINFAGFNWIAGLCEPDQFNGRPIREKYVLHQAEDLAHIRTLAQVLNEDQGTLAYAARVWVKAAREIEEDSDSFNQLSVFTHRSENPQRYNIIDMLGYQYIVRQVYPSTAGHLASIVEQLEPNALEQAFIVRETLDRVTQQTRRTKTPLTIFKLRWQTDFDYIRLTTPKFERGDIQCVTLSDDVSISATLELADGNWIVINTQRRDDVVYLHLRQA